MTLVPTLCVGMHTGRSASSVLGDRDASTGDAERPICIPTQSVGTRLPEGLLNLTAIGFSPTLFLGLPVPNIIKYAETS